MLIDTTGLSISGISRTASLLNVQYQTQPEQLNAMALLVSLQKHQITTLVRTFLSCCIAIKFSGIAVQV
ncbi:hypothetical protein O9992_14855 [Vibrio lentus]|nr:hypothetical protein [Vibrio lentus]